MLAELGAQQSVIIDTFAEASAALGYDLWALTQQGPEEQLLRSGACGKRRVVRGLLSLPDIASASIPHSLPLVACRSPMQSSWSSCVVS